MNGASLNNTCVTRSPEGRDKSPNTADSFACYITRDLCSDVADQVSNAYPGMGCEGERPATHWQLYQGGTVEKRCSNLFRVAHHDSC
jgi:hypothetical protein